MGTGLSQCDQQQNINLLFCFMFVSSLFLFRMDKKEGVLMKRIGMTAMMACITAFSITCAYAQIPPSQQRSLSAESKENAEQIVSQMSTREKMGQVLMLDVCNWGKSCLLSSGMLDIITITHLY
ncbi:hypothetical protein C9426_34605 [Serratia sp. S1B]|nr:hypothetical protein C9426_34605 [Serratia sp. S1B]